MLHPWWGYFEWWSETSVAAAGCFKYKPMSSAKVMTAREKGSRDRIAATHPAYSLTKM